MDRPCLQQTSTISPFPNRLITETLIPNSKGKIASAIIGSKIRYGIGIYGAVRLTESDPRKSAMNDLQVILNDAMRLLQKKRLVDKMKIEDLCRKTGIPSINHMAAEEQIRIVWGAKTRPNSPLSELFECVSVGQTRASTRGDLVTSARSSLATQNLPHTAITTWNKTDESLRSAKKPKEAKTLIKKFIDHLPLR